MPILFTHIHKSAGTSFKQSGIYPNIAPDRIYQLRGIRDLIKNRDRDFDFLEGHYPYGLHRFVKNRSPIIYLTILREPLDRCVSFYYFVKQCDTPYYQHTNQEDVNLLAIADLYALKKYQNIQTKFTAGWFSIKVARFLPGIFGDWLLLRQARHNLLHRYKAFGLLDRVEEFQEHVARMMGWRNLNVRDETKQVRNRPRVHELSEELKASILKHNKLDVELYRFAAGLYEQRRNRLSESEPVMLNAI